MQYKIQNLTGNPVILQGVIINGFTSHMFDNISVEHLKINRYINNGVISVTKIEDAPVIKEEPKEVTSKKKQGTEKGADEN